jgi:hypothetical protein
MEAGPVEGRPTEAAHNPGDKMAQRGDDPKGENGLIGESSTEAATISPGTQVLNSDS